MASFLLSLTSMIWLILVHLLGGPPDCVRTSGKTVCGHHCLAAHGTAACAKTPSGVCGASGSAVVCWDPPDHVRAHYGNHVPAAECETRSGTTVCGYHCEAHGDDVKCASSPDGICRATSRGITCWDPAPSTYCADQRALPRPECITLDGEVACGYDCQARNGRLACAGTPGGQCTALPEQILCWDPEPPPMCGAVPCSDASDRSWCPAPETP